jgi:hypothetical protein
MEVRCLVVLSPVLSVRRVTIAVGVSPALVLEGRFTTHARWGRPVQPELLSLVAIHASLLPRTMSPVLRDFFARA